MDIPLKLQLSKPSLFLIHVYELKGESASNIQIFITDSTRHFVTANLYFNTRPKPDSLAPAVDYIKKDLLSLSWRMGEW